MDERVEGEAERRKEGGRRNVEQCVRTTPFRERLSRAAWPSTLSIPLYKASRPPFDDEDNDNDYDGRTTRRRSCALLLHVSRAHPPRSLSLSPLVPSRYLPTRLQSLILPLPYLEPTTYTITRSLSNGSLSRFTLLAPLTLSISLFSSLTLRLDSLFLARPLLRHHLQPYISLSFSLPPFTLSLSLSVSRFIARSLASRPSSRPRTHQYCLPLSHHRSLLARRRLTRALILPYLPPRP